MIRVASLFALFALTACEPGDRQSAPTPKGYSAEVSASVAHPEEQCTEAWKQMPAAQRDGEETFLKFLPACLKAHYGAMCRDGSVDHGAEVAELCAQAGGIRTLLKQPDS